MTDLVVVVPSRGRPEAARELAEAFAETCTADTELVFSLDTDDATRGDYPKPNLLAPNKSMVEALNSSARMVERLSPSLFAIGFMGDDHRPRTKGWDTAYLDALGELGTGIVYGDDQLQHRNLPTQCAMTADIIRELGYMAPPALTHMYVDNFWLALGTAADCIRYLPDVVVEHLHPVAGKAQWDEGYIRVNDPAMYAKDGSAFAEHMRDSLARDVEKVRALRSVHA